MRTKHFFIFLFSAVVIFSNNTLAQSKTETKAEKKLQTADKKLDLTVAGDEPLIIVDGVEKSRDFLSKEITADQIESVNVIKGDKALEKYGKKGTNGVVVVVTKKAAKTSTKKGDSGAKIKIKPSSEETIKDYKILYVVDGEVKDESDIEQINPDTIKQIDVIKDQKEIAEFTEGTFDGMVKIELKKD